MGEKELDALYSTGGLVKVGHAGRVARLSSNSKSCVSQVAYSTDNEHNDPLQSDVDKEL